MTLAPFHPPRRAAIDDPAEIAGIEALLAALSGMIVAAGGAAALMGRDLLEMTPAQRAAALTAMYDDGEVVLGWRHGCGTVVNMTLERLEIDGATMWRAQFHVEEDAGHVLRGALAARDLKALGAAALRVAAAGDPGTLPSPGAALAAALRAG
ncbi:MAG: hypothetical protein ACK4WC_06470 [Rubrimonas sp.]